MVRPTVSLRLGVPISGGAQRPEARGAGPAGRARILHAAGTGARPRAPARGPHSDFGALSSMTTRKVPSRISCLRVATISFTSAESFDSQA